MDRVEIVAVAGAVVLLAVILEAIVKRRLREQYALMWLLTGVVLLVLALWRDLLHQLSALMGIYYPPSALFLIFIGLVVLILLNFSVVVSDLSAKVMRLTQKLALLEWEIDSMRGQQAPPIERTGSAATGGRESTLKE